MEEIGEANFRRPKIRKQGRLAKSLSDNSLNSLIEKEEFSTSEAPQRSESTDIVLQKVLREIFIT